MLILLCLMLHVLIDGDGPCLSAFPGNLPRTKMNPAMSSHRMKRTRRKRTWRAEQKNRSTNLAWTTTTMPSFLTASSGTSRMTITWLMRSNRQRAFSSSLPPSPSLFHLTSLSSFSDQAGLTEEELIQRRKAKVLKLLRLYKLQYHRLQVRSGPYLAPFSVPIHATIIYHIRHPHSLAHVRITFNQPMSSTTKGSQRRKR